MKTPNITIDFTIPPIPTTPNNPSTIININIFTCKQPCPHTQKTPSKTKPSTSTIVSVKSVPLPDIDFWLTQGYRVYGLYLKNATLVKQSDERI